MIGKRRGRPPQTHCNRGHKRTPDNTYIWGAGNGSKARHCRICREDYIRDHSARLKVCKIKARERHPERNLVDRARQRAKRYDLPFNLDISDVTIPEKCPILGIKLFPSKGGSSDNSPSLDKIVNERGYVKGNVRVISNRANTLKNNATAEELQLILDDIRRISAPGDGQ
jgi:hypothetical protein